MSVEVTDRDGARVVTLARPPVNAIELGLLRDAAAAFESARDPDCRALVLTGAPGVFSAGLDLKQVPAYDLEQRRAAIRALNRMLFELYGLPKPTVAAISGHAIAGGLVLALACDLRLAARGDWKLGLTEVNVGIPFPAAPMAVVEAELPPAALRHLTLGGGLFAADSPQLGSAVDRIVEPGRLLDEAVALALDRAEQSAYARIKRQLRQATLERLRRIVEDDADPMLEQWI